MLATALPFEMTDCWILSYSTRKFVKLSLDGTVTADGDKDNDSAVYVRYIAGTSPQQLRVESVKSTPDNVCFLTVEDGMVKSGTPVNGNDIFERVPVSVGISALRVLNTMQYLGFSRDTYEAGLYESIDTKNQETKFSFINNHE